MSLQLDSLSRSGLDTLSERALRRLTDRWTGELYPADSLATPPEDGQVASSDTFRAIVEGWQRSREVYHDGAVEMVMGSGSYLADGVAVGNVASPSLAVAETQLGTGAWWSAVEWSSELYNLLAVLLFLYYIYCLYRYYDDVVALLETIFSRQSSSSGRVGERRRSDIFYGSLGKLFLLGVCFVGVLTVGAFMHYDVPVPQSLIIYLPFAVVALFLMVIVVQNLLLGLVGVVTHSLGEVAALLRIRLSYFVLATLLAAPLLLVAMVGQGVDYRVWLNIGFIAICVSVILFVRESIGFFISKKVSILHWILYLCTVEILPLSLLWQVAVRLR
jgi:hypothetical protein